MFENGSPEPALQGRRTQRKPRTDRFRTPVRTPHVPRHATHPEFRRARADGMRRKQRIHKQRLYRLLYHAADSEYRNGLLARKRPHDRAVALPPKTRNRKTGRPRGVQPAIPQPALRRHDKTAARDGLSRTPIPLVRHRPDAGTRCRRNARGCRTVLPPLLPPLECHPFGVGRH